MKKMICFIFAMIMISCGVEDVIAQTVSFGQEDILSTSSEFEEISSLRDEMIDSLEALTQTSAEEAVIHYDRSIKIYATTDIFQLDTDDGEAILELLEEGDHIWMVPASLNGKEYELTITKGLPLREEAKDVLTPSQQQEVIDREGKWFVVGIGETDESFWEKVSAKSEELAGCQRVVIIMDLPGFHYPVALGIKDGTAARWVNLGYDNPIMEDALADSQNMSRSANAAQEGVFEFHELADRVDAYYDLSSEESGGAGSREDQNTLYWGGMALVILVGGILIAVIIRRKAKRIRL